MNRLLIATMLVVLCLGMCAQAPLKEQPFRYNPAEAKFLLSKATVMVDPASPTSRHLPPLVLEKINWLQSMLKSKQLDMVGYEKQYSDPYSRPMMQTNYVGGKFVLTASLETLLYFQRVRYGLKTGGPNRIMLNTVALALTHEAIHMERPDQLNQDNSRDLILREEARVWQKFTVQGIRVLRLKSEPLDSDFVRADDILRSCNDNVNCPAFKTYIARKVDLAIKASSQK